MTVIQDQAESLRQLVLEAQMDDPASLFADEAAAQAREDARSPMRVIAVTSGKGGVGKSNVAVNLGITLSQMGRRVCLLDADLGLANLDVLCNLTPKMTLQHVVAGRCRLTDVMIRRIAWLRTRGDCNETEVYMDRSFLGVAARVARLWRVFVWVCIPVGLMSAAAHAAAPEPSKFCRALERVNTGQVDTSAMAELEGHAHLVGVLLEAAPENLTTPTVLALAVYLDPDDPKAGSRVRLIDNRVLQPRPA